MTEIRFGRQVCGNLDEASSREWLVADGVGGYAMGTVGGMRTRRYHGLLVVATDPPRGRHLALAALDPVLVVGAARTRLGVHEWAGTTVQPQGFLHLESFALRDGVPAWRWQVGDVVIERELATVAGRPATAVVHRVIRASGPVRLELKALATWRDVHTERFGNWDPGVETLTDGFVFEDAYRVRGPGFDPTGAVWYRNVSYREEAARGLNDREDLFFAGRFVAELEPGDEMEVVAWAGEDLTDGGAPPAAPAVVEAARSRARLVADRAGSADDTDRLLAMAADQFVVAGPTVVAGYPWFGDWSRDTMTSYEGLFLETNRADDGRKLLVASAEMLSEGMLANTADAGGTEFNTVDGTLWFVHAAGRHVERTGDGDLARELQQAFDEIVRCHREGTRYGIRVDDDGLLTQGADGHCADVDGRPDRRQPGHAPAGEARRGERPVDRSAGDDRGAPGTDRRRRR